MAIFKCKMCGGALEINSSETIARCEYCGTQQTLPKLTDDRRANLYDRANHFRRNNDFDKAMGIYEQILIEDRTDAEAYWSLVLCRYGIEYVEDPASHKRIPTVNRAQFTSVFDDNNYKSALEYADNDQRHIYEQEAKSINEIQKGILAISQREEPFDVFICYKEADNNGRRTPDSVLAQDLYYQLKQERLKVFFARITLEDKLGTAYEPYIFAALNSAKVMVVLGTKPEHFTAVWVKNEWSRYLSLIKQGHKKTLIPAFKDMDPYDLPEEFSHIQAQDMSKLGFMQDLLRGIKKIIGAYEPKPTVVKETIITGGNMNTAPLLRRAFIFLEDGDWNSADEYCEKVLDADPECAEAYLGKLMSELHVKNQEDLRHCSDPFDTSNNYKKALRFADEKLKSTLAGYIEHINTRNENARLEGIFNRANAAMATADTEKAYKEAAQLFESISEYKDSSVLAIECRERAEAERERQTEIARKEAEAKATRNKRTAIITAVILCSTVAFFLLYNMVIVPNNNYKNAMALMYSGRYTEAISAFEALDGYKDSVDKIGQCRTAILDGKYDDALALMDAGNYEGAISAFEALNGYKDSTAKISDCHTAILDGKYNDAIALMDAGKITEAYEAFLALDGYKDSAEKAAALYDKYKMENRSAAQVGDYVFFGEYEQDNDTSNGKEPIEWLVLDVKDRKALVISKYALDCKPYSYGDSCSWENSTLRMWLNKKFISAAFSSDELENIPSVTLSTHNNVVQDKVFLLSTKEAETYFSSAVERQCSATAYAKANNSYKNTPNENCWWWLSDPIVDYNDGRYVRIDGVCDRGRRVSLTTGAVRPAMWIELGDSKQKDAIRSLNSNMTVSAGGVHTVGLKSDGTVVAVGNNDYGQCDVSSWRDIVAVSAGGFHTVGLKSDGTVVAVGYNERGQHDVSGWRDIVAVSAGGYHTVGLKSDGTVVAVGYNDSGQCDVSDWSDIVAISAGGFHTVGLKSDGTVVAVGDNGYGRCDVSEWSDIVAVSAGGGHTVGLKSDGPVVAVGYNDYGQCDVSDWRDIVAVSADYCHTVGLKSDGTVVAVGYNDYGQCDVSGWSDIVAVSAGIYHTVGLKSDGTVVAVGRNSLGQCDVSGWTDIRVPEV